MKATAALVMVLSGAPVATAQVMPSEANRRAAIERFWSGQELLQAERWERAATEFRGAIALNPLLTDAHYGLGEAQMGIRRYTSAALAFQACLEAARRVHALREKARVERDRQIWEEVDQIRDTIRRRRDSGLRSRQLDQYVSTLLRNRSSLGLPFEPPAPVLLALGSAHFRNGDRDPRRVLLARGHTRRRRAGRGVEQPGRRVCRDHATAEAEDAVRGPNAPATASIRA